MYRRQLLAGVVVLGLIGCSGAAPAHFEYPLYAPTSQAHSVALPVRVAIAYPEEGRRAPSRDQDLEPIVTTQCDAGKTYISPRLENSRCLLDELRATRAFELVSWVPESFDDYDLIVRMRLLSSGELRANPKCPTVLGPFQWDIVLTDRAGRELDRWAGTLGAVDVYAAAVVADFRRKQQDFFASVVPRILTAAGRLVGDQPDPQGARLAAWLDGRDPELATVRRSLASTTLDPAERDKAERGYVLRIAALESLHVVETRRAEAREKLKDEAWAAVQSQAARELQGLGEKVRAQIADAFGLLFAGVAGAIELSGLAAGATTPAALLRADADARSDLQRLLETPDGIERLLEPALRSAGPVATPLTLKPADGTLRAALTEQLRSLSTVANPSSKPDGDWMKEYRRLIASFEHGADASHGGTSAPPQAGCAKDTDCKGARICVDGKCVDPPAHKR